MIRTGHRGYVWAVLAAACIVLFMSSGSRFAFGVLLKPMEEDLGWSRGTLSLAATLFMFTSSFAMVAAGRLADRHGFKVVLAAASVFAAVGMGLLGWINSVWQLFLLYGLLFAIGNGATSISPVSVLVTRWFREKRGLAIGVAIAGGAIGQLVVISMLSSFMVDLGWRESYKILGLAIAVITLPVVLTAVRPRPQDTNLESGIECRDRARPETGLHSEADLLSFRTMVQTLQSRRFLLLTITYGICGFQDWLVGTHVVAFATDQGVSTTLAGNLLALMEVMGMAGVLLSGQLSDMYGPSRPTVICFLLRMGIFFLVMASNSTPAILVFALLYGFTFLITAPLTPVFVARFFGAHHLGALTGTISMVHQLGGGIGAFVGGVVFDAFGDYQWAFVIAFGLSIAATITTLSLREKHAPQPA